jgi:hypothetical protein
MDVMRSRRLFFPTGLLVCLLLGACKGTPDTNVANLSVDAGPANSFNVAFVTVTVCAPGSTTRCQTIDHVALDTGSSGLRIVASVLSPALTLSLPAQMDPTNSPLAECMQFADGFSWGWVKLADVKIGGETASSLPVQIIGDPVSDPTSNPPFPTIPTACASVGAEEDTVAALGANGILGVGYFLDDCGAGCATNAANGLYYACPSASTCAQTALATNLQVAHPVAAFADDNNGVMIQLPALPSSGAASARGSLIFGIGTQMNNGLGLATIIDVDPTSGVFTTTFVGTAFPESVIDAGSNIYLLPTAVIDTVGITRCTGALQSGFFLCPATPVTLSVTNQGTNPATASTSLIVGDAATLFGQTQMTAFNNLAAENRHTAAGFDWGLPFFFGRTVFVAIETMSTPGGTGPYVAY